GPSSSHSGVRPRGRSGRRSLHVRQRLGDVRNPRGIEAEIGEDACEDGLPALAVLHEPGVELRAADNEVVSPVPVAGQRLPRGEGEILPELTDAHFRVCGELLKSEVLVGGAHSYFTENRQFSPGLTPTWAGLLVNCLSVTRKRLLEL